MTTGDKYRYALIPIIAIAIILAFGVEVSWPALLGVSLAVAGAIHVESLILMLRKRRDVRRSDASERKNH